MGGSVDPEVSSAETLRREDVVARRPPGWHVDHRLSARAASSWPGATVGVEVAGDGAETWWLERPGEQRTGIGDHFAAATRTLGVLRRAAADAGRR